MKYVIVSVVKGEAGDFNNNLRKDVYERLNVRSSKLPAHFTIKSPFEYDGSIIDLENVIEKFCDKNKKSIYKIRGYNCFEDRVIFMDVFMSKESKVIHDNFIDEIVKVPYIKLKSIDGKDKKFHVTVSSKRIPPVFNELWEYVNKFPCDFEASFDNICIFRWEDNTWILQKEFLLK